MPGLRLQHRGHVPKRRETGDRVKDHDLRTAPDAEHGCPGFVTALVLRCGQGDKSALLVLMELLYLPVRARLATADLPSAEMDELVGRAFIHIWQSAPSYDPSTQTGVVAWLLEGVVSTPALIPPALAPS